MSDAAARIAARMAEIWRTSRPTILERVSVLRAAREILTANPGDAEARSHAREAAHKLSGILGSFGLPQGSEIAHLMEERLKSTAPLTPADLSWLGEQTAALESLIAAKGEG